MCCPEEKITNNLRTKNLMAMNITDYNYWKIEWIYLSIDDSSRFIKEIIQHGIENNIFVAVCLSLSNNISLFI